MLDRIIIDCPLSEQLRLYILNKYWFNIIYTNNLWKLLYDKYEIEYDYLLDVCELDIGLFCRLFLGRHVVSKTFKNYKKDASTIK